MRANVVRCRASLNRAFLAAVQLARSTANWAQPCRSLADPRSPVRAPLARSRIFDAPGRPQRAVIEGGIATWPHELEGSELDSEISSS
jgi:hypothetical protein